jgi:hypothetical protein
MASPRDRGHGTQRIHGPHEPYDPYDPRGPSDGHGSAGWAGPHDGADLKELLGRLGQDASQLAHDELTLARLELRSIAETLSDDVQRASKTLVKDVAKVGIALTLATLAGLALTAGAVIGVGVLVGPTGRAASSWVASCFSWPPCSDSARHGTSRPAMRCAWRRLVRALSAARMSWPRRRRRRSGSPVRRRASSSIARRHRRSRDRVRRTVTDGGRQAYPGDPLARPAPQRSPRRGATFGPPWTIRPQEPCFRARRCPILAPHPRQLPERGRRVEIEVEVEVQFPSPEPAPCFVRR